MKKKKKFYFLAYKLINKNLLFLTFIYRLIQQIRHVDSNDEVVYVVKKRMERFKLLQRNTLWGKKLQSNIQRVAKMGN